LIFAEQTLADELAKDSGTKHLTQTDLPSVKLVTAHVPKENLLLSIPHSDLQSFSQFIQSISHSARQSESNADTENLLAHGLELDSSRSKSNSLESNSLISNNLSIQESSLQESSIQESSLQKSSLQESSPQNMPVTPPARSQVDDVSPIALAYIGDAVFELYVRSRLLLPAKRIRDYHTQVVSQVKTEQQADYIDQLIPYLNDSEKDILRRGRNATTGRQRRAAAQAYQKATGFEALIGFLYLSDQARLLELLGYLPL
jgi:ribonuclease III family protein